LGGEYLFRRRRKKEIKTNRFKPQQNKQISKINQAQMSTEAPK